jgi:hypothetical protein
VLTYARAAPFAKSNGVAHLGVAISTPIRLRAIQAINNPLLVWTGFQIPMVIMGAILIFVLPNAVGQSLEKINEAQVGL